LVTGYAPLVHQLMAIIAHFGDLETSFGMLALITVFLLIYSIFKFSESINLNNGLTPYVVALLPAIYLFIYVFGQLPGLFSLGLMLLAIYELGEYLSGHGLHYGVSVSILLALAFMSHYLVPVIMFPLFFIHFFKSLKKKVLFKTLGVLCVSALFVVPIAYELYVFMASTPAQAFIWHPTRTNILFNEYSLTFFWGLYGPISVLIPLAIAVYIKIREYFILALSLAYFVVGLGGSTPIPRVIFGESLFNWLTYEKFSFIALILFLIPVMYYIENEYLIRLKKKLNSRSLLIIKVIVVASFFFSSAILLYITKVVMPLQPPPPPIDEIANFLNSRNGLGFYITLGLGVWSRALALHTSKPFFDGGFNSARRLPILANSGVESIDSAKYFPNGTKLVKELLSNDYGIRWVVLGDDFYRPLLESNGYKEIMVFKGERNISIWENPGKTSYGKFYLNIDRPSYFWGLEPLTLLLTYIGLNVWREYYAQ